LEVTKKWFMLVVVTWGDQSRWIPLITMSSGAYSAVRLPCCRGTCAMLVLVGMTVLTSGFVRQRSRLFLRGGAKLALSSRRTSVSSFYTALASCSWTIKISSTVLMDTILRVRSKWALAIFTSALVHFKDIAFF
jgi:hypothetical protein